MDLDVLLAVLRLDDVLGGLLLHPQRGAAAPLPLGVLLLLAGGMDSTAAPPRAFVLEAVFCLGGTAALPCASVPEFLFSFGGAVATLLEVLLGFGGTAAILSATVIVSL